MRCDNCGRDIPEGEQVLSTRSEQVGTPGYQGAHTSTEPIWLCRKCADECSKLAKAKKPPRSVGAAFREMELWKERYFFFADRFSSIAA